MRANGLIAISLDDHDELAWVRMTSGSDRVVLVSTDGQAIQFDENDVRPMGRPAAGVLGMKFGPQDKVIGFDVVAPDRDLLVVASHGLGKRTGLDQYPTQKRGGQGVRSMKLAPGVKIVAAAMASPEDGVVLMNNKGITIKFAADTIRLIGRSTQGVTLMRLGDGETVVSMTVIRPSDPASTAHLNELELAGEAPVQEK